MFQLFFYEYEASERRNPFCSNMYLCTCVLTFKHPFLIITSLKYYLTYSSMFVSLSKRWTQLSCFNSTFHLFVNFLFFSLIISFHIILPFPRPLFPLHYPPSLKYLSNHLSSPARPKTLFKVINHKGGKTASGKREGRGFC